MPSLSNRCVPRERLVSPASLLLLVLLFVFFPSVVNRNLHFIFPSVEKIDETTFYSIARTDRSGAFVHDMLLAHAYAFTEGNVYGGTCMNPPGVGNKHPPQDTVRLLHDMGWLARSTTFCVSHPPQESRYCTRSDLPFPRRYSLHACLAVFISPTNHTRESYYSKDRRLFNRRSRTTWRREPVQKTKSVPTQQSLLAPYSTIYSSELFQCASHHLFGS